MASGGARPSYGPRPAHKPSWGKATPPHPSRIRRHFRAGQAGPQAGSGGGRGDEEAHVVQLAGSLIKEVVEGEVVHEPLGGVDAIAVLVVVRGVVGVGDDDHVILRGLSAHVVVADDDLPVAAPVIPADHDGVAVGKRLLDVVKGEDVVDVFARVNGGVAVKAAHALEDIQHLGKAGRRRHRAALAQLRKALFGVAAAQAVPFERHQGAGNAAAPFAGLLDGLEVGEDGQRIGGSHVVEVELAEVRAVRVVAQALDAVRAVLGAQVAAVIKLHLVGVIAAFFGDGGQAEGHAEHKQPYDQFFHCSSLLKKCNRTCRRHRDRLVC